jgi:hypothetical protein
MNAPMPSAGMTGAEKREMRGIASVIDSRMRHRGCRKSGRLEPLTDSDRFETKRRPLMVFNDHGTVEQLPDQVTDRFDSYSAGQLYRCSGCRRTVGIPT